MRYGFYLPTRGQTATPEALETLVKRGESLGFASVMIADHLVFPVTIKSRYPYRSPATSRDRVTSSISSR